MTEPVVDDPVGWCVANALKDCFCAALEEVSAPATCCCLAPGQQVMWDACDPGMAWVRVANIYQLGFTFPQPARPADLAACGGEGGWAVTLELGALRCMPQPDHNGNLPSCDEVSAVTRLVLADGNAMRRAMVCCDWLAPCDIADAQRAYGAWTPLGPQGVCVGGTMTVTVEVAACICPDDANGTRR